MRLRSALFALGLRYRVDYPIRVAAGVRPIRPDIVFTRARIAIFVDGCFWHSCPKHGTAPVRNSRYWTVKLARNQARDRRYDALLKNSDWTVLRFWEHEDPADAAQHIASQV
jgi:DNA mismatch endonuclease (patch repair protein)